MLQYFTTFLIFCILLLYYWYQLPITSHLSIELVLNLGFVKFFPHVIITNSISYIPKDCIKEYVRLDLRLPPYSYDHIKILEEPRYNGTSYYYPGVLKDVNKQCWDFNASYICLTNMYCCYRSSFLTENLTYIKIYERFWWIYISSI